jgi:high-affinity iron transporter
MFTAALLAFREGLEAALIIGIVLGVLRRMDRGNRAWIVWLGTGLAALISLLVGGALHALGLAFEGRAEELFEGTAMLLAAGVLTWMIFWMARQGRALQTELERDVRRTALSGGTWALFSLAFVAVLREGIELALFLTAAAFTATAEATLIGGVLGLILAVVAGWLLFTTSLRLDIRAFFRVTSVLLILFAAGLVAHGVHEFNEVGWIPSIVEHVWDVNPLLDEGSELGQLLKALLGYNGNPSLTEVIAYVGYWAAVLTALWRTRVRAARVTSWVEAT